MEQSEHAAALDVLVLQVLVEVAVDLDLELGPQVRRVDLTDRSVLVGGRASVQLDRRNLIHAFLYTIGNLPVEAFDH